MKELRCAINKVRRHGRAGILAGVGQLSLEAITRQSTHMERLRSQPFIVGDGEFRFGNHAAPGIEPTLRERNGTRGLVQPGVKVRGREYPLELSGAAWIDPDTGAIAKIIADIQDTLQDVGLKSLRSQIEFSPLPLPDSKPVYWFPTQATVEVETPRQHWRNLHRFSEYKKFSVGTEEKVTSK